MSIDWAATGSMLSGWATLAGAGAVVYAAKTGANTFAAWKRQRVEERRMHAAEKILTLAYRLRYNFKAVRSRGILDNETEAAEAILDEQLPHWRSRDQPARTRLTTAQTILNRLSAYRDDWNEVWALKPLALAFFGQDVEELLHRFWTHYIDVEVAASEYAEYDGTDTKYTVSLRRSLFTGKDDELAPGVESTIRELEQLLLPVIRADPAPVGARSPETETLP